MHETTAPTTRPCNVATQPPSYLLQVKQVWPRTSDQRFRRQALALGGKPCTQPPPADTSQGADCDSPFPWVDTVATDRIAATLNEDGAVVFAANLVAGDTGGRRPQELTQFVVEYAGTEAARTSIPVDFATACGHVQRLDQRSVIVASEYSDGRQVPMMVTVFKKYVIALAFTDGHWSRAERARALAVAVKQFL